MPDDSLTAPPDVAIRPLAQASDVRHVWKSYRAPCRPHETGCRQCGNDIRPSRAYCSVECSNEFERNHFWGTAAAHAIWRARSDGHGRPTCARCGKTCGVFNWRQREAEVNHKVPVNGNRPHFGCCHHQENLEVLCHSCHVAVTKEQRRAGLIGPPKPPITFPLLER